VKGLPVMPAALACKLQDQMDPADMAGPVAALQLGPSTRSVSGGYAAFAFEKSQKRYAKNNITCVMSIKIIAQKL
jgi:hypothetical protein